MHLRCKIEASCEQKQKANSSQWNSAGISSQKSNPSLNKFKKMSRNSIKCRIFCHRGIMDLLASQSKLSGLCHKQVLSLPGFMVMPKIWAGPLGSYVALRGPTCQKKACFCLYIPQGLHPNWKKIK